MNQDAYILLLYKELKGDLTPEESQLLQNWLKAGEENRALADEVRHIWKESPQSSKPIKLHLDSEFQRLQDSMNADAPVVSLKVRSYRGWAIAASFALLLSAAWWFFLSDDLASSQQITFTAQQEKAEFELPDGTQVWLAPNSTLTLANDFGSESRILNLEGMGYFQVATDSLLPFRVQTDFSEVTVLGTAFNLRAFKGEPASNVFVAEGRISFTALNKGQEVILSAGEGGEVNHTSGILTTEKPSDSNEVAWQRGTFVFNQSSIEEVFHDIENHYQITIQVDRQELLACLYTGRLSIDKGQDYILGSIADFLQAELSIEKGIVLLRGGNCN